MVTTDYLLNWYRQHARDLPWRHTHDPYRIWISEIMLQQTQVKTVLPRYLDWFIRFPDISSLANASLNQVYKQWEGLGYYRRARFIHESANIICNEYNGTFPQQFEWILSLKGIGRSTAGAIASFCFDKHTPVLDANVKRVISSWEQRPCSEKELWQLAQKQIQQTSTPGLWNQAMMELGATLCQARKRTCEACPVSSQCKSAFSLPEQKSSTVKIKDVHWSVQLFQCQERGIWLEQRPVSGIWGGLWAPPIKNLKESPESEPDLIHQLTHRKVHLYLHHAKGKPHGEGCWVKSWQHYALPTGIQRLFKQLES